MKLKFAKKELKGKSKIVDINTIIEGLKDVNEKIFYFDRENEHKDLMKFVDTLEEMGYRVYLREIRFGLNDNDYLYEVHILK